MQKKIYLKDVPLHHKIPGTDFVVDFYKNHVIDSSNTFLTHFHSDHYCGLNKNFDKNIYCSITTANLILLNINIDRKIVKEMEMKTLYRVQTANVLCYEANHCPGAVCFVFNVKDHYYLHTGDFRYSAEIHGNLNKLINIFGFDKNTLRKFDKVFYDNTYESYPNFRSQKDVISDIIHHIAVNNSAKNVLVPLPTKYVFPSYSIGKEILFLCVAYFFRWKINVSNKKMQILNCYCDYTKKRINETVIRYCDQIRKQLGLTLKSDCITTKNSNTHILCPLDYLTVGFNDAVIDVVPTSYINKETLSKLYGGTNFKKIIVFCGTGWKKKSQKLNFVKLNGTTIKNGIEVYQYPYSEHSSNFELLKFCGTIKYLELIPTVKHNFI